MLCAGLLVAAGAGMLTDTGSESGKAFTFNVVAAFAFTILGALIVPRQPHNPVGHVFVVIALASALVVASAAFSSYPLMAWLNQWIPALAWGSFPLLLLLFPDGRLPSPSWRPVAVLAVVGTVVGAGGMAIAAWDVPGVLVDVEAPRTPLAVVSLRVARVGLLGMAVSAIAAIASLVVRFRTSRGDTRQQLKWLAVGGALVPVAVAMDLAALSYVVTEVVAATAVPATATMAILKYRLYDIDLFINRSLVYAVLTVLVVGAYAAVVTVLGTVLAARASWAPPAIAAAVIALVFQPLRERVQHRANRLLYGDRDDPYAVLSRLGRRLEQSVDPGTVLANVVQAVAEALQLPYAAIELRGAEGDRLAAGYGRAGVIEPERFSLSYQGQVVGTLLVSPRSAARPFSPTERGLLADLARQAGLAAHAVRLTDDLQRSRDRIVRSREEERRRLRRDLHDGLGPALAGMTMQIGATRAQLAEDGQVGRVLTGLEEQLQGCVVEIRRLIDDLRPPALDEVGLVDGIRHRLGAFAAGNGVGPTIEIEAADDLGDLPAAVEVAAYRIALEAVTNVVRHARARRCRVCITLGDDLVVEVTDDGVGLAPDHRQGVGLASMRERAEELGGTLTAEALAGGGTRIRADLPLAAR